ncbi:MAG: hypothetical protein J1E16_04050 [Muribaculaceae bacterium]|nr:hypothetical protein [Muribaculaceae bacterium]
MNTNLKELLDITYELEGLLHLALKREEDIDDFVRLISKKGEKIYELSNTVIGQTSVNGSVVDVKESPSEAPVFDLKEYSLDDDYDISELASPVLSELFEKIEEEPSMKNNDKILPEQKKGKLVFSINERFRFRRELFDNSDADFNNTMALVASMENYDEAEDYFLNEEGFDSSDPVVIEFLDVIKRYYK